MNGLLSDAELAAREGFRAFAAAMVAPHASAADAAGRLSLEVLTALRAGGYLGTPVRAVDAGSLDAVAYGLLTAEIGRACASARTLLTVHDLVCVALKRWGKAALKDCLLPTLANGSALAAIALSEPHAGSDAAALSTTLTPDGARHRLNGHKSWISFGALADWFLVFARAPDGFVAVAIEGNSAGLMRRPVEGMVGTRGSMMAELTFDDCVIEPEQLVGRIGFGLSHVAATALDFGRYSVAWGSVGIAKACCEQSLNFVRTREQFGAPLIAHQLVRARIARMTAATRAAELMCVNAGRLRDAAHAEALMETMIAKYFAARTAVDVANEAVQLHGARGLSSALPLERHLRDAKVMEIIEGSADLGEVAIGGYAGLCA